MTSKFLVVFHRLVLLAMRCAIPMYAAVALHSVLVMLLYLRPIEVSAGIATCPSPIFGRIGSARSGSCICSFSQNGVSLSCSRVSDNILGEMLNAVDLASVESLKIENSNIRQLPSIASMKPALKLFRCKNCNLRGSQLPCDMFKGFEKLTLIDLSNNPLETLCSTFFTNALKKEAAEGTEGTEAAPAEATTKINLSNTKLKRIPPTMFGEGADKVVSLDVSGNKLTYPLESGVFTMMTGLEELGMSDMGLDEFHASWFNGELGSGGATGGTEATEGGEMRQLPDAAKAVAPVGQPKQDEAGADPPFDDAAEGESKIKKLDLSHNVFRTLRKEDVSIFKSSLEALDLSHNRLQSLPNGFLADFVELNAVTLANNRLKTVPANLFTGNSKLAALSLANNPLLQSLPVGLFSGTPALRDLSLANLPKLKSLSQDMFSSKSADVEPLDVDIIDLRGTRIPNKEAILQQAQAVEGPVEVNVQINAS